MPIVDDAPVPLATRSRFVDGLWLAAVLVASSLWCVTAARASGATVDEPAHMRPGLERCRTGSHGPLLRLGAMPLAADVCTVPLYLVERWRGVAWDLDRDWRPALHMARHAALAFWWALLVHVWRAARHLGGRWAGSLAVALVAFEPSFLGHAALATTDVALAAAVMALTYWYAAGRDGTWWQRVGLPALLYGVAIVSRCGGRPTWVLTPPQP